MSIGVGLVIAICAFSAPLQEDRTVEPGATRIPPYPKDAIVTSTAPIALTGGGGVTDTGQATYTMPIRTPDGPGGLKPDLSLIYSGGGNGHLGVGMALSGPSAITPCRKTFASEGMELPAYKLCVQ